MTNLISAINNKNLISLNVDIDNFKSVIINLKDSIKNHENRIFNLENKILDLVSKSEFSCIMNNTIEKVDRNERITIDCKEIISSIKEETMEKMNDFSNLLDDKYNELLLSTSNNSSTSTEALEQKITELSPTLKEAYSLTQMLNRNHTELESQVKELRSNLQTISDEIKHVRSNIVDCSNGDILRTNSSNNPTILNKQGQSNDIVSIKDEIIDLINRVVTFEQQIKSENPQKEHSDMYLSPESKKIFLEVNNKLESLQKATESSINNQTPLGNSTDDIWQVLNKNRELTISQMNEQNLLSLRVDVIEQVLEKLPLKNGIPIKPIFDQISARQKAANVAATEPLLDDDSSVQEHAKLALSVDSLGDKIADVLHDILKIKNAVNKNEKGVKDLVLAIIDEFKLIRTNATGLEHLPPLNLAKCVPSFFNNPSFTFERGDESSSYVSDYESEGSSSTQTKGQRSVPDLNNIRETSEELEEAPNQLVKNASSSMQNDSGPDYKHSAELDSYKNQRTSYRRLDHSKGTHKSINDDMDRYLIMDSTEEKDPVIHKEVHINYRTKLMGIDRETIDEFSNMMKEFLKNKDEIMIEVERKVDRDVVERLFNKFRTILNSLNDKIKDIAYTMKKFATQEDMQTVAEAVAQIPVLTEQKLEKQKNHKVPLSQLPHRPERPGANINATVSNFRKSTLDTHLPQLKEK